MIQWIPFIYLIKVGGVTMKKSFVATMEALSVYSIIHILMHVIPIIIALILGVSEHLGHEHNHSLHDTLFITLLSHLALPFFSVYATSLKQTNCLLHTPINLLHKH